MRKVILYKTENAWIAECPTLCVVAKGKTAEDAIEKVKDLILACIDDLKTDNIPIPAEADKITVVEV